MKEKQVELWVRTEWEDETGYEQDKPACSVRYFMHRAAAERMIRPGDYEFRGLFNSRGTDVMGRYVEVKQVYASTSES